MYLITIRACVAVCVITLLVWTQVRLHLSSSGGVYTPDLILLAISRLAERCHCITITCSCTWVQVYLGGFGLTPVDTTQAGSPESNSTTELFNWHPLLMVIAFIVCMTEGVNAFSSISAPRCVLRQCCPATIDPWRHQGGKVSLSQES